MKNKILPALLLSAVCFVQALSAADESAGEPGFKSIFNGKDLAGWDGSPDLWSVRDGAITGQTTAEHPAKENTFLIWTNGVVGDFEMRFSFKLVPGDAAGFANSGVQYRSRVVKPSYWVVSGYQADMEAGPTYTGILYEEKARGILAKRGEKVVIGADGKINVVGSVGNAAEIEAALKKGDWNDYIIIAKGNHLTHIVNGRVTVDVTDEQAAKAAKSGILALQLHAGHPMMAQFKNIRLKILGTGAAAADDSKKKIILVAGTPSHGPGAHEFNAGVLLLKGCLDKVPGVEAVAITNGWPKDANAFNGADAIVLYMDGADHHPAIQGERLTQLGEALKRGAGLACLHFAVEVPADKGGREWLNWIGGYFETFWSVNPTWVAEFKQLPAHPITRGVKPFTIKDEWYYHMRFQESRVTPILSAVPPDSTREHADDAHGGNEFVRARKGMSEDVAWAYERPDGGRGFGFTGAHYHQNWGNDDFRKLVLNAIVWVAKGNVPADGVQSSVTPEELAQHLDPKGPKKK